MVKFYLNTIFVFHLFFNLVRFIYKNFIQFHHFIELKIYLGLSNPCLRGEMGSSSVQNLGISLILKTIAWAPRSYSHLLMLLCIFWLLPMILEDHFRASSRDKFRPVLWRPKIFYFLKISDDWIVTSYPK